MKKILFYALAGILFASCSSNDDDNINNERIPIDLSSRLSVELPRLSRQDTQIAENQQVSFFVTRAGDISDLAYNNVRLTADGRGGFASEVELYYPIYTDNTDFYAIHPYANITLGQNHTFSVLQDQSSIRNFLNSDLLYVKRADVERQRDTVQLRFNHRLTKISFVLTAGSGTSLEGLSSVQILNVRNQTILNTSDGTLSAGATTVGPITAYGLADGTASVSENQASDISAIIVPQTVAAGSELFRITINGVDFIYTTPNAIEYLSGMSHRYILTLTNTGIEVTSSIIDWVSALDTEGTGTIQ